MACAFSCALGAVYLHGAGFGKSASYFQCETCLELVEQREFLRFYADGKGVSAQTGRETYTVRLRLYELEERLDKRRFVRISNSEIVNLDRVTALDLSLAGTIRMTLDRTVSTYVSRRYVKRIKEALGLRKERQP